MHLVPYQAGEGRRTTCCSLLLYNQESRPQNQTSTDEPIILSVWPVGFLPGTGDFLAPALLAKFGDDRERLPSASSLQSMAGTCPVTEQGGKGRRVVFRQACDHEFRQIAQQWAKASVSQSSWASTY